MRKQTTTQNTTLDAEEILLAEKSQKIEHIRVARKPSAIFNIVNTIIGGGILALPASFSKIGVSLGVVLLVISALLVIYSSYLLIKCSSPPLNAGNSYQELAASALGTWGPFLVRICLILFLIGALSGYVVVLGDYLKQLTCQLGDVDIPKPALQVLIAYVILFPLLCLRQMNSLSYTSLLAIMAIIFMMVGIIYRAIDQMVRTGIRHSEITGVRFSTDILSSLPLISFAFTFHTNIFPIWNEMKDRSSQGILMCIVCGVGICGCCYILVGIFGYITFYSDIRDNILSNYSGELLFDIIKIAFCVLISLSYPVIGFGARDAIDTLIFKTQPAPRWRIIAEAFGLVTLSYGIAVALPKISLVFGYVGATFGQLIVYIFPALFYLVIKTEKDADPSYSSLLEPERKRRFNLTNLKAFCVPIHQKLPPIILFFGGIVLSVAMVYQITYEEVNAPPSVPSNSTC